MPEQRPLGRIRTSRLKPNGGGTPEPTKPGRHRRVTAEDVEPRVLRIPAPRKPSTSETDVIL